MDDLFDAFMEMYDNGGPDGRDAIHPITLAQLFEIEPGARDLVDRAAHSWSCDLYGTHTGPPTLWDEVRHLAGWDARCPALRSSEAYDLLFNATWEALRAGPCPRCEDWDEREGEH
jgi:hypothetical protein